ncbi:MAG: cytochrome c3 family protein [Acidimicrobiia bacterium]|nr:cytochrome c3 family protein [Acidimicrobiia bacterium]
MRRRFRTVGLVVCVMAAMLVPVTGAMAQDASNVGDPAAGAVDPHGGYSSTTQFCLQCHDVHNANGSYGLMGAVSVTAVCQTCHALPRLGGGGVTVPSHNPTPNLNPDGSVKTLGTTSSFSAYDLTGGVGEEHTIGATDIDGNPMTQSAYQYRGRFLGTDSAVAAGAGTAGEYAGGLYCASCHTAHGEYGQVVNDPVEPTATSPGDEGVHFYQGNTQLWLDYSGDATNPNADWFACEAAADVMIGTGVGTACAKRFDALTINDEEGKPSSLFGYKLLSSYPNHTWGSKSSFKFDNHAHDVSVWCSKCHDSKSIDTAGIHNHPTGCLACHGNPSDVDSRGRFTVATAFDFPHTSPNAAFLRALPDALCISCHTRGSLP